MHLSFDPAFLYIEINPEKIIQKVGKDICGKDFPGSISYGGTKLEIKLVRK